MYTLNFTTIYIVTFTKWLSIVICSSIYWVYLPFPGKVTTCMLTYFSEMTKNCQVIVSCCTCRSKTSFQLLGCSLESGGKVISLLILKWRGNKWFFKNYVSCQILMEFHKYRSSNLGLFFSSNVHLTVLICFHKVVSVFWFFCKAKNLTKKVFKSWFVCLLL